MEQVAKCFRDIDGASYLGDGELPHFCSKEGVPTVVKKGEA